MSTSADRASRFPWPPLLFVGAIAVAIVASMVVPLPWFVSPLSDLLFATGCIFLLAFAALYAAAMRPMMKARTTISPIGRSEHLVTSGAFALSRNPIYLANTILIFGVGLIAGSAWFFVTGLVAAALTQWLAIRPEERHLTARFGKRYLDYSKRVRRWV